MAAVYPCRSVVAASLLVIAGLAAPAAAQYTTPNVINTADPVTTTLNGTTFTNYGLVGVGRISASLLDAQGSTFGSVSSMSIVPGSWGYDASTGQYSGQFYTLPDRGRNDPANNVYVNYQARIQNLGFTFTPLYNGSGASQNQVQFDYRGLTLMTEPDGRPMVGMDPGTGVGTAFGRPVPRVGGPSGNIAIDAEGLVTMPDGSYYVSDEYGSAIYRFNAQGVLQGVINPPEALMPRNNGGLDFNSGTAPQQGRRNNQGMEGLSLSPDGRYLMAMNQSGAMQDSMGPNQANRRFTRVMVYDLQNNPLPTDPIGQYVVELPTTTAAGNGAPVNRTAAASEIVALSATQFMILSRDSNGRGPGTGLSPVFRSMLLADLSNATNLQGSDFALTQPVSPNGSLASGIIPVATTEAVNMLNMYDLERFGINTNLSAGSPNGDSNTLSEKWEGMTLLPDLATADPTDYFLFVANDNDFLTTDGVMHTTDGETTHYSDSINNDTMFLVYRVSIVPVPGAAVLAGLGLAMVGRRRRA